MKTLTNLEKAKTLREIRKRIGWTQERMSEALNLDSTYLSQLENDRRPVDDYYVTKVAEVEAEFEKAKSGGDALLAHSAVYANLESSTLQSNFAELAHKLSRATAADRKSLIPNLRAMLNELEQRDFRGKLSSKPLSSEVERALSASGAARQLAQGSGRKQKAGAPSAGKRGPASGAGRHQG